jgi:hypothetical protein
MGFAALNPSYARSTCEVVGFLFIWDLARFGTIQACLKDRPVPSVLA